jgi:hypothetical protein
MNSPEEIFLAPEVLQLKANIEAEYNRLRLIDPFSPDYAARNAKVRKFRAVLESLTPEMDFDTQYLAFERCLEEA